MGTGLKEMLVKSGVILKGTANKILSGRGYYQSSNAHMHAHEAVFFLWWSAFEDFCLSYQQDFGCLSDLSEKLEELWWNIQTNQA